MTKTILVVEDDKNLRLTLADNLEMNDYHVLMAPTLAHARQLLEQNPAPRVDLCVLDLMLPDGSGYDLARWMHENYSSCLILMLTARSLHQDIDEGFESGADDYMLKPYRINELLLRIKALLRRAGANSDTPNISNTVDINGVVVNWAAHTLKREGQEIVLTKKQYDLLAYLYQHLNEVKSRDDILDHVWGEQVCVDNRTVDNFISTLKKLLHLHGDMPYHIKTVRGVGYSLLSNL